VASDAVAIDGSRGAAGLNVFAGGVCIRGAAAAASSAAAATAISADALARSKLAADAASAVGDGGDGGGDGGAERSADSDSAAEGVFSPAGSARGWRDRRGDAGGV
jgi:hypothetical protein